MKQFLGSMYCNACSAEASKLIDPESKKLRIHISSCKEIVKGCINTWNLIYSITHIANSYYYLSSALRHFTEDKEMNIPVDPEIPETILKSGYISSQIREIVELQHNQELFNEIDSVRKVCD